MGFCCFWSKDFTHKRHTLDRREAHHYVADGARLERVFSALSFFSRALRPHLVGGAVLRYNVHLSAEGNTATSHNGIPSVMASLVGASLRNTAQAIIQRELKRSWKIRSFWVLQAEPRHREQGGGKKKRSTPWTHEQCEWHSDTDVTAFQASPSLPQLWDAPSDHVPPSTRSTNSANIHRKSEQRIREGSRQRHATTCISRAQLLLYKLLRAKGRGRFRPSSR